MLFTPPPDVISKNYFFGRCDLSCRCFSGTIVVRQFFTRNFPTILAHIYCLVYFGDSMILCGMQGNISRIIVSSALQNTEKLFPSLT